MSQILVSMESLFMDQILVSMGSLSYGPETRLWEIKYLIQDCYQDKTSWQGSRVTYQQTTKIVLDMVFTKKKN